MERKLAAIIFADVVGYSRLMGEDSVGTLTALRKFRNEILVQAVEAHHGRVAKSMGDGWLIEFASVVDATNFSIHLQGRLTENRIIKLRIGLHLGDITHDEEDIFGDGVNIASRLQDIADPGCIVISDLAWRSIDRKLAADFKDLGVQQLKNIAEPVKAYGWGKNVEKLRPGSLPIIQKSTIAIMPFHNMSGDEEQEYFADGITEDIITDLSKLSGLFVISRNTTFRYKSKHVDVQKAADELNVRYVMEGRIRKAGDRIRINVQLIDGKNGNHIWAERYDRILSDIFSIQDEITESIVQALKIKLEVGEKDRFGGSLTHSVEAYDLSLRAREHMYRMTPESNAAARSLYESALALDPDFSRANSELALVLFTAYKGQWNDSSPETLKLGVLHAKMAIELAPEDARARRAMAYGYLWNFDLDNAVKEADKAFSLEPNTADVLSSSGYILGFAGRSKEAIARLEKALHLDPEHPAMWLHFLGHAYFVDENYEAAIAVLKQRIEIEPNTDLSRALLAVCYGLLGLREKARDQWTEVNKVNPDYFARLDSQLANYKDPAVSSRFMEGLRMAEIER